MVGLIADLDKSMSLNFKGEGDLIFLIGKEQNDVSSSEYLHKICGVEYSPAPYFDLEEEYSLQEKIKELIAAGAIVSAHDISEGGVFITLVESGFFKDLGFDIHTSENIRKDAFLFGEAQSRVIVTVPADDINRFRQLMGNSVYSELGRVTAGDIQVDGEHWGSITEWKHEYDTAIERLLKKEEFSGALTAL
jgi:phosphoribosylformylglycinamidine synthase